MFKRAVRDSKPLLAYMAGQCSEHIATGILEAIL